MDIFRYSRHSSQNEPSPILVDPKLGEEIHFECRET